MYFFFIFAFVSLVNKIARRNDNNLVTKRNWTSKLLILAIIMTFFSPFDICVKCQKFGIKILPVALVNGQYATVRKLENLGMVENKDFIVYYKPYAMSSPRWCIILFSE